MPRPNRHWLVRYGGAVVITVVALGLRMALEPLLGGDGAHQVWGLFYVGVVVATMWGGLGPGLVSMALGLGAGWFFFLEPRLASGPFDRGVAVGLAVFVVLAVLITVLVAGLQEARRRTEALAQIFDRGPILARDFAGRIVWWTSGAESLYGYTAAEAMGQVSRVLLETEFPCPLEEIEHQVRTRGEWQGQLRQSRKDGTRLWVTSQWLLHRTQDGNESILEVQTDSTARIAAEEALRRSERATRESEARFRLMADSAPVLIWVSGPDGQFQFVNRRYLEFLDRPAAAIRPDGWQTALHPDDAAAYLDAYRDAATGMQPFRALVRMRRHDDSYRWMDSVAVPRVDDTGQFLGYVGCSFDVTEQREAEEALREAARRKDEFLAMLAHELRNPLAPIRNAAGVVRALAPPEPRLTRAHEMIERQVGHLTRLVDDLLDVSRITRGKIVLQRAPVAISDVVHEAVDASRPFIEQHKHQLFLHLARERLVVEGDADRLVQVVSNLLGNAAKFTPPGGEIHVTTAAGRDGAEIHVRDTGIGVPKDRQAAVFELFAQEHTTIDRSRGGLGIGLTLVKQIVEQHGGTVTLTSGGTDLGSEFTVTLPLLLPEGVPATANDRNLPTRPSGVRVLIVEDNRDAAESFSLLLRLAGHEVQVAHDGLQALRVFDEFAPQVAFIDLGLPGIDGFEVARRLRKNGAADARLIALSGYGRDEDKARAREAGFDDHLTKPVDERVVNEILVHAEDRARSSA